MEPGGMCEFSGLMTRVPRRPSSGACRAVQEIPRPPAGCVRFSARGDFNEHSSDVDLLVEFDDMPDADRADAYLGGFLMAVEALLRSRVDLVELGRVRNPYLRRGIEESRELIYAA